LDEVRAQRGAFFARERPISVARAPGRLDVMGGIADYSGSLVLELPLALVTLAAVQLDPEPVLRIRSVGAGDAGTDMEAPVPLAALQPDGKPASYDAVRALFQADPQQSWAAYVAGCWLVLLRVEHVLINQGARVLLHSTVPAGKGVSSSA